jgi:thiol-disulfide isomerase/thioredoxin
LKDTRRSFSTIRGLALIGVFFIFLILFSFFRPFRVEKFDTSNNNSAGDSLSLPLDVKLAVFRDSTPKKRPRNSKVTLRELIDNGTAATLINFWATWCPPCLEELPSIEMLQRRLAGLADSSTQRPPSLITISVDDRIEDISKLESTLDFKPSFLVLHDKEGELARTLGTTKFPETYLVNPQGKIIYKWLGPQNWLSSEVIKLLKNYVK